MNRQEDIIDMIDAEYEVNIQLAENENINEEELNLDKPVESCEEKRKLLEKTKIVKQTWSISEIYQKICTNPPVLNLSPEYQRKDIWDANKKTAFIESLYMGIIIPPIYVVEILGEDFLLDTTTYEVVDGKQRLTTIKEFLQNGFALKSKSLEYYKDVFGEKMFSKIREEYGKATNEMLSSVLDIYVITANSSEFTKYDIFSRLNKGAEKLRVNEIRKAIYRSKELKMIEEYVESKISSNDAKYYKVFSDALIKRYDDYGRFFRSLAFFMNTDVQQRIVIDYNSRPREMINNVLIDIQQQKRSVSKNNLIKILDETLSLMQFFDENRDYYVDACIYFAVLDSEKLYSKLQEIKDDTVISGTFVKSAPTTTQVNKRLGRVCEILGE